MQGQPADPAVDLIMPISVVAVLRQILGLDDEAAAGAAAVHFLQADDVERPEQLGDTRQIGGASGVGSRCCQPPVR